MRVWTIGRSGGAKLMANENWRAFLAEILPLLASQESKIPSPTAFSPIR